MLLIIVIIVVADSLLLLLVLRWRGKCPDLDLLAAEAEASPATSSRESPPASATALSGESSLTAKENHPNPTIELDVEDCSVASLFTLLLPPLHLRRIWLKRVGIIIIKRRRGNHRRAEANIGPGLYLLAL